MKTRGPSGLGSAGCWLVVVAFLAWPAVAREPSPGPDAEGVVGVRDGVGSGEIEPLARFFEDRVVAICAGKPSIGAVRGTGFFIRGDGLVATADHVVGPGDDGVVPEFFLMRAGEPESKFWRARLVRRLRSDERGPDIALLQAQGIAPAEPVPFFEFGEAEGGDEVSVAGFPLVFDKVYRWPLLRFGRVASTRYHLREAKVYVLDLTSAGGFSGAPVVRLRDRRVVAVLKGKATGNVAADFSLGTSVEHLRGEPPGSDGGTERSETP